MAAPKGPLTPLGQEMLAGGYVLRHPDSVQCVPTSLCAECSLERTYPGKSIRSDGKRNCLVCGRRLPGAISEVAEIQYASPPIKERIDDLRSHRSQFGDTLIKPPSKKDPAHPRHQHAAAKKMMAMPFYTKKSKPSPKPARLAIPEDVRFMYFGAPKGERKAGQPEHQGVMTVAYRVSDKLKIVSIGYSFCSPKDRWVKSRGQSIALQRLENWTIVAHYLYEPRRLVMHIAQALMEHSWVGLVGVIGKSGLHNAKVMETLPSWTHSLAKWLKALSDHHEEIFREIKKGLRKCRGTGEEITIKLQVFSRPPK